VRNEAAVIESLLLELLGQNYPADKFEVLVADGRSDDGTTAIVQSMHRRFANLRWVDNPKRLSSAGRNAAFHESRGDIIVVVDGHCEIRTDRYLLELVGAFTRSGAACIGRPQPLDVKGAATLQLAIACARACRLGHQPASFVYSGCEAFVPPDSVAIAYRRDVFSLVGMFDETFDACEDVEFNHRVARAGFLCFFSPRLAVHYHPRATLGRLFRQMMRYGSGRLRLLRKCPDTFSLPCFAPALWLAFVITGAMVAGFAASFAYVYVLLLLAYLAVIFATSIYLAWRASRFSFIFWLPLVFLTLHAGAGAGAWREVFRGRGGQGDAAVSSRSVA
jgi:succinoglycan biosynthesis protein ExoA